MIMVFKVDPDLYKAIKEIVGKGSYESVESFVEIALLNQLQLEKHGISSISKTKGGAIQLEMDETESKLRQPKAQSGTQSLSEFLAIPRTASLPVLQVQPVTEETRASPLWGQINRLMPAKFVLRLLANQISASGNDRIDLKVFSADVAENATLARSYIEKKDKAARIRGEELYVGFPKKDPGSQKRFISFYVGKLPSGKWTDGVLTGLSLAGIDQTEEGSTMIGLTEAGKQFACLPSPLIDDFLIGGKQIENPFSNEEIDFLLRHLGSSRPGDYEYLISVLKSVKDGANTPTSLRGKVSKFLQDKHAGVKFSDKAANTMLVGAVGRLVEMRLLEIEKDAQKSKYIVTSEGEKLFGK